MRSTPARLAGATAALALVALPALALGQQSPPTPAPPASSGPTTGPVPSPVSGGTSGSTSGGSSGSVSTPSYPSGGYSGGGYSSGGGSYSPGRVYNPGGGRFDGPSRYAPGAPGGGSGSPTPVVLPPPRAGQPGGARGYEPTPVAPGRPAGSPEMPGYAPPRGAPVVGGPGTRLPFEGPGRVEVPGRVPLPGVVGVPDNPDLRSVTQDGPRAGDDGDTRILPPPLTPPIGGPPVGKPLPPPPPPPPPSTYQPPPPPNGVWADRYWYTHWYGWGWHRPLGYYGYCYPGLITEEDEYWARVRGYYTNDYGCGGRYGYGYGSGYGSGWNYGYWTPLGWSYPYYGGGRYLPSAYGYGSGFSSLYFLNLQPCAVVTAETYSGRRYTVVTMLPEFGAYGPMRLRSEIQLRLREDGEITLHGRGSQELHLFDGFVKRVNTRWCGPGEW